MKGQFYFLRAYTYFRLVSLYGGVPLVLTAQELDGEDLNTPRSKTSECIAAIVKDLDSSCMPNFLLYGPRAESGRITRAAAWR